MNLVSLSIPTPTNEASDRAQQALAAAEARQIVTAEDYTNAASELQAIKGRAREIDEQRKKLVAPIDAARRAVQDFFTPPLDWLSKAETVLKRKLVGYQEQQEAIRREEQRKAEEAARRERERLEAAAREAQRKAAERAAAERRAAEEAAAAGRAEEAAKLAARAEATETKAAEKAERLELQAAAVVAPVIQREAPKVAGIKTREVWLFEVTDPTVVPREYLVVDETRVRKVVNALKSDCRIPGVRVYPDKSMASSARQ